MKTLKLKTILALAIASSFAGCKTCKECPQCTEPETSTMWQQIQFPVVIPHAVKGKLSLYVRIQDGVVTHTYGHMLTKDGEVNPTNYIIQSEPVDASQFPDLPEGMTPKKPVLLKPVNVEAGE